MIEAIKTLQRRIEVLERNQNKTNIRGIISEIDPERGIGGSVRVSYGNDQLTDWLPVKPLRAGKAKVWWFPEVDEAVTVTDIETGEVIPGSYTTTNTPVTRNPNHMRVDFGDGSYVVHDRERGKLKVLTVGDIEITTRQNATINVGGNTNVNCDGSVSIESGAKDIALNGGKGVVTGAHICQFTGKPHSDCSSQVKAGK